MIDIADSVTLTAQPDILPPSSIEAVPKKRNSFIENIAQVYEVSQIQYDPNNEFEDIVAAPEETHFSPIQTELELEIPDTVMPALKIESDTFQLPENQLRVNIKNSNGFKAPRDGITGMQNSPLYLITSVDEFSRDLCTVHIGESMPNTIPTVDYNSEFAAFLKYPDVLNDAFEPFNDEDALFKSTQAYQRVKPTRILHHYHPGYPIWNSNFKCSPSDKSNLFIDKPGSDSNILLKVSSCLARNCFEPLFGSLTLFLNRNDELIRLSETFNFDVTPDAVKARYGDVYKAESSINEDPINPVNSAIRTCLIRVPHDLQKDPDLYFVIQISKVLSGDSDKAVAPYLPRSSSPALPKHEEQCNRLSMFRQIIGLGIIKVYDDKGCVGVQGKPGLVFRLYAQKGALTEAQLLTNIKELYPKDGTQPYTRMDISDIELKLSVIDVGRDSEMTTEWSTKLADESVRSTIKDLELLPPPNFPLSDDIARKACISRDNSVYVYPLSFEKITHRNLSLCVQLIEYEDGIDSAYSVLNNIYSTVPGPQFCAAAYTKVVYHAFNPAIYEEIKVRLPNVLTHRHALRFAVYHVHVKPKQVNPTLFSRFSSGTAISEDISILVGEGYLPLVTESEGIIGDEERTVSITMLEESSSSPTAASSKNSRRDFSSGTVATAVVGGTPTIRIRTRVMSALFSTCSHVQRFLNLCPVPLGILPSSRLIRQLADFTSATASPSETALNEVTRNILAAQPGEVAHHFLLIMRQLIRVICGGRCVQSEDFGNPFNHPPSRCTAFLGMLQTLGKIAPDVYKIRDRNAAPSSEDLLNAYVDFVFDEEVPDQEAVAIRSAAESSTLIKKSDSSEEHEKEENIENAAAFVTFQVERIIMESFISAALLKSIGEVPSDVITSKLYSIHSPSKSKVYRSSPFKDVKPSKLDKEFSDFAKGIELKVKSRRMSGAMMHLRRALPHVALTSPDSCETNEITLKNNKVEYGVLDGFGTRTSQDTQRWWPFVYEVLVQQWINVLCVLQGKPPPEILDPVTGKNVCSIAYPFSAPSLSNTVDSSKDTRLLLLDHAPFLFQLVFKSLALRIERELKLTPIVLDATFLSSLDVLIEMLSDEAASRLSSGLTRSKRLNLALAHFLRRLFAVVAPLQVAQLIGAYFRRERVRRSEEIGLRLQVVEELGAFDHFISVNFPSHLDSHLVNHRRPSTFTSKVVFSLRGIADPAAHWLAHLCIEEVMFAYRLQENSLPSIRVLRDLLVRHSYDARHQDVSSRQRIAVMYIPLLFQIIAESERLSMSAYDSAERRELLAILLFLLQDLPERQLREQWRQLTLDDSSVLDAINEAGGTSSARRNSVGTVPVHDLPILRLLKLLHLALDTFDYPAQKTVEDPAQTRILVPGLASEKLMHGVKPLGAAENLRSLDELMYRKKGGEGMRRDTRGSRDDNERKWTKQRVGARGGRDTAPTSNGGGLTAPATEMNLYQAAAKGINHEGTLIVLKTLSTILEEVPPLLLQKPSSRSNFDDLMSLSVSLLLHGLLSNQSEMALIAVMEVTRVILKRFGARTFTTAAGDSFQDWLRRIYILCAYPCSVLRHQACDLLLLLFQSSFYHGNSLTLFKNTSLGVFHEVMDSILNLYGSKIDSVEREDEFLSYLRTSLLHMGDSFPTSLINDFAAPQMDLQVLHSHIYAFMECLDKILMGNACLRRYIVHPVGHDWLGANLLDGPYNEHTSNIVFKAHSDRIRANISGFRAGASGGSSHPGSAENSRPVSLSSATNTTLSISSPHSSVLRGPSPVLYGRKKSPVGNVSTEAVVAAGESDSQSNISEAVAPTVKFDLEAVMDLFVEIAEIFDPILLPRFRMRWLENLARLHDAKLNRAEAAEIRWRLYLLCEKARPTWDKVWAPRAPLLWTGEASGDLQRSGKSFLQLFHSTVALNRGKWWRSPAQFQEHMETCLNSAATKFASVSLFHLAEWSYQSLLSLYRLDGKLADMGSVYQNISGMFKAHLSSSFAMGLFYRVLYIGKGCPEHLRGSEYIYRNANSLHLADFQKLLTQHLTELAADGVKVSVVLDTTKIPNEDTLDAVIYLASVKPTKLALSRGDVAAPNQCRLFQYSVPFTQEGGIHARSIELQWKRTTYLEVSEPFPYVTPRQLVTRRSIKELRPIETAIDDISQRIDTMSVELRREKKDGADTNNLMRIVQGSVMPQVNGGAAEVARVFLGGDSALVNDDQKLLLQKTIFNFLSLADKLLEKSRRILIVDAHRDDGVAGVVAGGTRDSGTVPPASSIDVSNYKWQIEMEVQFDLLIETIRPFVKDFDINAAMFKLIRKNRGVAPSMSNVRIDV